MNVTLRQVRVFVAVAMAESFTAAASRLCLTQSTLTKSVRELESCIGLRLFERTTRRVELTSHGTMFLPIAQRLLNDFDFSIADLRNQATGHSGTIRLCAETALSATLLPQVVKAVHARHPAMRIDIQEDTSRDVVKKVAAGKVDFGFGSFIGEMQHNLSSIKLLSARWGVLYPAQFQGVPDALTLEMLCRLPLIFDAEDFRIKEILQQHHLEHQAVANTIAASSLATQFSLVRAGVGPCVVTALAASHPSAKEFHYRLIEAPPISLEVYALFREHELLPPAAHVFLGVLKEMLPLFQFHPGVAVVA